MGLSSRSRHATAGMGKNAAHRPVLACQLTGSGLQLLCMGPSLIRSHQAAQATLPHMPASLGPDQHAQLQAGLLPVLLCSSGPPPAPAALLWAGGREASPTGGEARRGGQSSTQPALAMPGTVPPQAVCWPGLGAWHGLSHAEGRGDSHRPHCQCKLCCKHPLLPLTLAGSRDLAHPTGQGMQSGLRLGLGPSPKLSPPGLANPSRYQTLLPKAPQGVLVSCCRGPTTANQKLPMRPWGLNNCPPLNYRLSPGENRLRILSSNLHKKTSSVFRYSRIVPSKFSLLVKPYSNFSVYYLLKILSKQLACERADLYKIEENQKDAQHCDSRDFSSPILAAFRRRTRYILCSLCTALFVCEWFRTTKNKL